MSPIPVHEAGQGRDAAGLAQAADRDRARQSRARHGRQVRLLGERDRGQDESHERAGPVMTRRGVGMQPPWVVAPYTPLARTEWFPERSSTGSTGGSRLAPDLRDDRPERANLPALPDRAGRTALRVAALA